MRGRRRSALPRRLAVRVAVLVPVSLVAVPGAPAQAQAQAAQERRCVRTPSPTTAQPWQQARLQPERVWRLTQGRGITVAVIDSGVDARSPHLRGAVVQGPDLLGAPGGPSTNDCSGHGTAVASLVAGRVLPGTPFAGIAPAAQVLSVRQTERVEGEQPRGDAEGMARAIRAAVDAGAEVVNVSVTAPSGTPTLRAAVDYALARDVVLVAAAGNDDGSGVDEQGEPLSYYPAAYPEVLAVAATGTDDGPAEVSHVGDYVDVAAPGQEVVTAGPVTGAGRYGSSSGTSYAAPLVSGTAALVRAYHPELTAEQVVARIVATADAPATGRDDAVGAGVLNVYEAVTAVLAEEGAAGRVAGGAQAPPVLPVAPEPRDQTGRVVALSVAAGGALLAALVAVGTFVLPRGRRRRWRAGRAAAPALTPLLTDPRTPGADLLSGERRRSGS